MLLGSKSGHYSETLVLDTSLLPSYVVDRTSFCSSCNLERLQGFLWIEWVNHNVQGTITSAEVARQQCVLASITWCGERLWEAAELEICLTGNQRLPVWLTCKLPLGWAGSPWLGIRICCDVFSQCVASPELVLQAELWGQDCCYLVSHSFSSSCTVQCSIIIFSCFQRDVFNKGLLGSSA